MLRNIRIKWFVCLLMKEARACDFSMFFVIALGPILLLTFIAYSTIHDHKEKWLERHGKHKRSHCF